MPDTTEGSKGPKVRVYLKPEAEPTMFGFVRWKLVPLPAVEQEAREGAGPAEPSTSTP